ncbi:unnamed protein product [Effrenium voratum]|nr:unnamed protein product [Effrenium voratum]
MAASVLCRNACGRECGKGADGRVFTTCCKSCAFLKEKHGYCGHDIDCDIRANDAVCPPWYWKAAAEWPGSFHEEVGGEYVKEMGTKILRRRLPEWRVLRCERIEDAVLWDKYTAKRAQCAESPGSAREESARRTSNRKRRRAFSFPPTPRWIMG